MCHADYLNHFFQNFKMVMTHEFLECRDGIQLTPTSWFCREKKGCENLGDKYDM